MKVLKSIYSFFCKPIFSYLIFWGWNFIFLILLLNCIALLVETVKNVITGFTPLSYSICVLFFLLIPVVSIILGFTLLKNNPKKLLKFFYGVELPLWILFLLKFTLFRELTVASSHIFLVLFFGLIGYIIELFSLESKLPLWYKYLHKLFLSFLLFIGITIFLVGMFYSFPIIINFLIELFSFEWISYFRPSELLTAGFFIFILLIFFIITFPLVILLPMFIVFLYTKIFINNFKKVKIERLKYLSIFLFAANLLFFIFLNNSQPQQAALEIASKNMSVVKNRTELYENEEAVKNGLLNSYLNKYRYISSTENNHIEEIYKDCLKNDFIAKIAQNTYNYLMSPFLYKGDREKDSQIAKELYESNFDIGIQKDNKKEILKALSSTWDRDGAEAGILNINQEKVLLLRQEINVKEGKGVASIEVHEIYKNVTFDRQEIFYYFTIPSNTVVNGLWLSDNDSIAKKYSFKVSPRGAAQQIYKEEVRKRIDPSLLEQVGPFQYRLRAFPILPKRKEYKNNKTTIAEGDNFHLWISFKTIISSENDWKMPQLIEKRNVYWNDRSIRYLNGKKLITEGWLPKSIKPKGDVIRNMFIETLNDSVSICVKEKMMSDKNYLKDKRISFIIDGSYSMRSHLDNLKETLNYFSNQHISNESMLYIFDREGVRGSSELSKGLGFKKDDFYGTISNIEVLHKFNKQKRNQDYIIYITDEGGYDETIDSLPTISFNSPLIVFHLNNSIAPIYADAFLESIQRSKGFISEDLKDINNRLFVNSEEGILSYQDGIVYEKVSSNEKDSNLIKDIVAYKYINNTKNEGSNQIDWLDEIHRIAVENKIVTKFSSMIVLVNDIQKKRLEELEKNKDRFDREKEDGEETLTNPGDLFSVNATPEPEEWVLISFIVIYVFYYYRKKVRVRL